MADITASMVKDLRDRTGIGMGKCKQALEVAGGDIDLAIVNLRKEGMATAVKKEGRETKEGIIASAEKEGVVSLLEINTETDFVSRNERFHDLVKGLALDAAKNKSSSVEDFLASSSASGSTIEEIRAEAVQSLGENIQIRRVECFSSQDSSLAVYIHMGGKIGVFVEIGGDTNQVELAKEIALHIAAEDPKYIDISEVPEDIKENEKEIGRAQVKGKPDNIIDKILEGKLGAFYDQTCLLRQSFVKDSSLSISALLEKAGKEAGKTLTIKRFVRWVMGS